MDEARRRREWKFRVAHGNGQCTTGFLFLQCIPYHVSQESANSDDEAKFRLIRDGTLLSLIHPSNENTAIAKSLGMCEKLNFKYDALKRNARGFVF